MRFTNTNMTVRLQRMVWLVLEGGAEGFVHELTHMLLVLLARQCHACCKSDFPQPWRGLQGWLFKRTRLPLPNPLHPGHVTHCKLIRAEGDSPATLPPRQGTLQHRCPMPHQGTDHAVGTHGQCHARAVLQNCLCSVQLMLDCACWSSASPERVLHPRAPCVAASGARFANGADASLA